MGIQEARNFIQENRWCYSDKNVNAPEDIKTTHKYWFVSYCGHEFYSSPLAVIKNNKILCPVCSGRAVSKGINDLNTIVPHITKYLYNPKDGEKYTAQSNHVVKWKCPFCNYEWEQSINKMVLKANKCPNCSFNRSYAEKIVSSILDQLRLQYQVEAIFNWSDNRRYDFYISKLNLIIEVNGKQHYSSPFPNAIRTTEEEKANDEYKFQLAINNGVKYYIVLDTSHSSLSQIKKQIANSQLPELLHFNMKDIDWLKCDEFATQNIIFNVCQDYASGSTVNELINKYSKCKNTIMSYLRRGTLQGWCNYDPNMARKKACIDNGVRVIKTMSKPVLQINIKTGETIQQFPSLQQAQRELNINHIWDCIQGRRKTAGGYKWRYA